MQPTQEHVWGLKIVENGSGTVGVLYEAINSLGILRRAMDTIRLKIILWVMA